MHDRLNSPYRVSCRIAGFDASEMPLRARCYVMPLWAASPQLEENTPELRVPALPVLAYRVVVSEEIGLKSDNFLVSVCHLRRNHFSRLGQSKRDSSKHTSAGQMPLISEGIANWVAAAKRAEVVPTPGSKMFAGFAAENLLSRLNKAGIDTSSARSLLSSIKTTGQGDQKKRAGGRIRYQQGGDVERPFDGAAPDYDIEGARAAGVTPDERGHLPDTYKLPNHITLWSYERV
jgi:hypothetical protein